MSIDGLDATRESSNELLVAGSVDGGVGDPQFCSSLGAKQLCMCRFGVADSHDQRDAILLKKLGVPCGHDGPKEQEWQDSLCSPALFVLPVENASANNAVAVGDLFQEAAVREATSLEIMVIALLEPNDGISFPVKSRRWDMYPRRGRSSPAPFLSSCTGGIHH